ncbi:MAG: AI-2E family transporter [Bacteroidaceae bacterium]|nr:AI-2E family transporter [Bacteroidaceae bacterium]MBQ8009006.1 AI-2E family transporter [Bacteroidaceae bacterium]
MIEKKITFDSFIRAVMGIIIAIVILMVLNRLSSVLLPFFVAWLIAYLIFPLVKFFQYKCRMKYRVVAIILAILIVTAVGFGIFYLIVPPMISESLRIKDLLVEYIESAPSDGVPALIHEYIVQHLNMEQIKSLFSRQDFLNALREYLPKLWNMVIESVNVVFSFFSLLMILLYTIFILLDYESISEGWVNLVPKRYRPISMKLVEDVKDSMNKYFRGQALVASCVGILFCIGFLIIDFPLAIGLGIFIGFLNMVPYLQIVGFIPTIILSILKAADTGGNFWLILLSALAVFAIVQIIQDSFLTPKIMGKVTGLSPAIILLSLSIWGSLMGMMGMIIALPITSLLIAYYQKYVINREHLKHLEE